MEIDDLCSVENVSEENIVKILKGRYEKDITFTNVGDILLSINYDKKIEKDDNKNHDLIKDLAHNLFYTLKLKQTSQCLIVTGELGSGKTTAVAAVRECFLKHTCCHNPAFRKQITQVSSIFEGFGTASTSLNDSATRFVQYTEFHFNPQLKCCSAQVTEYLLENSRVISTSQDERNFKIFFWMFSGRTEEELSKQLIQSPSQHKYLRYGEGFSDDLVEWSKKYQLFTDSLQTFTFQPEEMSSVFGILAAILHLGDIKFKVCDKEIGVFIENLEVLDKVAILLGVDVDELEGWFTCNVKSLHDDNASSFKTHAQATKCRDNLATSLYDRLFKWMIYRVNSLLLSDKQTSSTTGQLKVSILAMFGFEQLKDNSLEQLCVNAACEQLQLYFLQHVFAWEQLQYEQEEIEVDYPIEYCCNKEVINLMLEEPHGLFPLLEEESRCQQADDNTLLSKLNAHCCDSPRYQKSSQDLQFVVVHFTRKVSYSTEGFLTKNTNQIDNTILAGLQGSMDKVISSLYTSIISKSGQLNFRQGSGTTNCCDGDLRKQYERKLKKRSEKERKCNTSKASRHKLKKTLTQKKSKQITTQAMNFRNSLVDLMEKLLISDPHFLRCIKASSDEESFDTDLVLEQLRYMNVVETVRIRKYGYPHRLPFQTFVDRYKFLHTFATNIEANEESCSAILNKFQLGGWKLGKTKVFLRLWHFRELNDSLDSLTNKIILVQKVIRGYLARVDFEFLKTNQKVEERAVGQMLVSISSRNTKMHDNLVAINEIDRKRHSKQIDKDLHRKAGGKENSKRKLTKTNSDPAVEASRTKPTSQKVPVADSPNRKVARSKTRVAQELIVRNFTATSVSAWCRIDCYERQHHVASFHMDQPVVCVDGTTPVSDKYRVSFLGLPTRSEDPKVLRVKSCIGKGVQLHQDERQNLWATRLGKNPIFVRGNSLCPELVKLDGKLTQGVPMKVFDTAAFKENMKKECEAADQITEEVREKIMSQLKVCMSFIKDTVVDEETPCWFQIWLVKVSDNVKRYLDNYQKRRENEEKRRSGGNFKIPSKVEAARATFEATPKTRQKAPPMRRAKSGDALREKLRSHSTLASPTVENRRVPSPRPSHPGGEADSALSRNESSVYRRPKVQSTDLMRREKSMDVRLEQRLLGGSRAELLSARGGLSPQSRGLSPPTRRLTPGGGEATPPTTESPEQTFTRQPSGRETRSRTVEDDSPPQTAQTPTAGMSYRQVFGLQPSDYLLNVATPNIARHRRFSDSDTESLQNFVHRIIPQEDRAAKSSIMQPKKWIKKVRRKSEDNPKKKFIIQQK